MAGQEWRPMKKSAHTWEIHTTDEMKHHYSTLCGLNSTLTQSGPEIIDGEFKDAFKIRGKDTSPDPNTGQSSDIKNLTKQTKNMLHAIYQGSSGCISEHRTHILKPIPKPVKKATASSLFLECKTSESSRSASLSGISSEPEGPLVNRNVWWCQDTRSLISPNN